MNRTCQTSNPHFGFFLALVKKVKFVLKNPRILRKWSYIIMIMYLMSWQENMKEGENV